MFTLVSWATVLTANALISWLYKDNTLVPSIICGFTLAPSFTFHAYGLEATVLPFIVALPSYVRDIDSVYLAFAPLQFMAMIVVAGLTYLLLPFLKRELPRR